MKENSVGQFLSKNSLALAVHAVGVVVLILNLWLAVKLAPLAQNLSSLTDRVSAIEVSRSNTQPLIERFYKLEEHTDAIDQSLNRIETKLDKLDTKIDSRLYKN